MWKIDSSLNVIIDQIEPDADPEENGTHFLRITNSTKTTSNTYLRISVNTTRSFKSRIAYFTCYLIIWLRVKFQRISINHLGPRATPLDKFQKYFLFRRFFHISQTCCSQCRHILRRQLSVFKIIYCIIIRSTIKNFWLPTTEVTLASTFY